MNLDRILEKKKKTIEQPGKFSDAPCIRGYYGIMVPVLRMIMVGVVVAGECPCPLQMSAEVFRGDVSRCLQLTFK